MDVHEAITEIRAVLVDVQKSGEQIVLIRPLLELLTAVEREAPLDLETRKLQHESNLAYYYAKQQVKLAGHRARTELHIEKARWILAAAKTALTTSILVNGGATVALLAFLGNLYAKSTSASVTVQPLFVWSLISFAIGVLAGAVATGTTYASEHCYAVAWKRWGRFFQVLTIVLVVGTYIAFLVGVLAAYQAFMK
jgi:hypothetical protein